MCGIVGYVGERESVPILMDALRRLEYRGYDSAGLAVIDREGRLIGSKAEGKLDRLAERLANGGALHGGDAGTNRLAILVHGTGAAERHSAAELRAGESENVAQIPEQRHRRVAVKGALNTIDLEFDHEESPGELILRWGHCSARQGGHGPL